MQIAEGDIGHRMVNDNARPFQAHKGDEQANARGNSISQRNRQDIHHLFAQTYKGDQNKKYPSDKDGTERVLPRYTKR